MKTAVSLPDTTFRRADLVARRLGLSRSEPCARALDAFMGPPSDDEITARLDAVYDDLDSAIDSQLGAAQRRAL